MCWEVACVGRRRCGFWYYLAPLVWNIYTSGSHLQKEKQKQKNKQQKTCLWLLLPTSEQTFMELPGNRNWHWASKLVQNAQCQMLRENMTTALPGNSGEAHPFPKGCSTMSLLWNSVPFHGTGAGSFSWHDTFPGAICGQPSIYANECALTSYLTLPANKAWAVRNILGWSQHGFETRKVSLPGKPPVVHTQDTATQMGSNLSQSLWSLWPIQAIRPLECQEGYPVASLSLWITPASASSTSPTLDSKAALQTADSAFSLKSKVGKKFQEDADSRALHKDTCATEENS